MNVEISPQRSVQETAQRLIDSKRLLISGLHNHDQETVWFAWKRLVALGGKEATGEVTFRHITNLMTGGWVFVGKDGGRSSLL